MKKIILCTVLFLSSQICSAGLLYNYSELALKDLDQMSQLVQARIRESQKSKGDQVVPLKEALQAVFSRPNEDGMVEKVLSPLKNALDEQEAWEGTMKKLTNEAVGALRNPKAFKPVVQVTYLIFLENLVAEIKPRTGQKFENALLQNIRSAQIKITKEASQERVLRMMKETRSPSELAEEVLKSYEEMKKNQPKATPTPTATPTPVKAESSVDRPEEQLPD